jgi:hypothetical protein
MVFDMDRKVFIFTRSLRSPLQGAFRWSFPRLEGLGYSVKPLRGSLNRLVDKDQVETWAEGYCPSRAGDTNPTDGSGYRPGR